MQQLSTSFSFVVYVCVLLGMFFPPARVFAEEEEPIELGELEVSARPLAAAAERRALASSSDLLAEVPGVELRGQGGGAQMDLQIRGSSFSGAGWSIAGMSLRSPQTEHFAAELPLPGSLFSAPSVVTGVTQAAATSGHLIGSVNADFAPIESGGRLRLGLGERGSNEAGMIWKHRFSEEASGGHWGVSLFALNRESAGFDYPENDWRDFVAGLQLQYHAEKIQFDLALGSRHKVFGAQGFYGVSPSLPAYETVDDTLLVSSLRIALERTGDFIRFGVSVRRLEDDYILNERDPEFYRNQHQTVVSTLSVDGRLSATERLAFQWRLDLEYERIDSSGIYKSAATEGLGKHNRQRLSVLMLPEYQFGDWVFRAGGRLVALSDESPVFLPLAELQRDFEEFRAYLSYSESIRRPSFTELDYESPNSLGNRGLENERAREIEVGLNGQFARQGLWRVAVFQRWTKHAVDWIRSSPTTPWIATDLGEVRCTGLEADFDWQFHNAIKVGIGYQYLHKRSEVDYYASRYAMDVPEHEIDLRLFLPLGEQLSLALAQNLIFKSDNPERTSSDIGAITGVSLTYAPIRFPHLEIILSGENLLDDDFEQFIGQPSPGRRFFCRAVYRW